MCTKHIVHQKVIVNISRLYSHSCACIDCPYAAVCETFSPFWSLNLEL